MHAELYFFFQAEDGIRDKLVTGVQTCALPISLRPTLAYRRAASGYSARNANLKMEWKIRPNITHATTSPSRPKPLCWVQSRNFSAARLLMISVTPVLPSSGGTGSRLNVPSSRLSTKKTLSKVAANVGDTA